MARIERASPEVAAPVKQAVLIDPNAFKFTGAGEGLKAIGGVLTELGERRKKARDSLSITETNNSQSLAQAEIKQFMVDNPNPDDWEVGIQGILEKQDSTALQLKSSLETRARIEQSQKAFREQTLLNSSILQTEATISIDVQSSGAALIAAMGTGDELAIEEARDTHEAALLRKEAPEIAALSLVETLKEGKKSFFENQSKLFPDKTIKQMEAKKKALGKKDVDDDGLNAKDYDTIIASAITAKNQAKKVADTVNREAKLALYESEDEGKALTRDDFNAAYQDPDEADQHFDEYVAGQNAEQKGEANFVKLGDPIILARTEAVIDLNPASITEEQIYENSTRGIGTQNVTRLVDRLRKAKQGLLAPESKYNTQFATLLNAEFFGEKDEAETSIRYLELKRKMTEFITSQKPSEAIADNFFAGLITKEFKGWGGFGGWDEKGFKHKYLDAVGNTVTQRFRFGDIRIRKVGEKTISEFYGGTDKDGDALWLPRQGQTTEHRRGGNLRPDGTKKDIGFRGVLELGGKLAGTNSFSTEYSVQSDAVKVDGKRIDFPTLVTTLTQEEEDLMVNDIIPNRKPIPETIMQKAIKHAKKRLKEGKSVFFQEGEKR